MASLRVAAITVMVLAMIAINASPAGARCLSMCETCDPSEENPCCQGDLDGNKDKCSCEKLPDMLRQQDLEHRGNGYRCKCDGVKNMFEVCHANNYLKMMKAEKARMEAEAAAAAALAKNGK